MKPDFLKNKKTDSINNFCFILKLMKRPLYDEY